MSDDLGPMRLGEPVTPATSDDLRNRDVFSGGEIARAIGVRGSITSIKRNFEGEQEIAIRVSGRAEILVMEMTIAPTVGNVIFAACIPEGAGRLRVLDYALWPDPLNPPRDRIAAICEKHGITA